MKGLATSVISAGIPRTAWAQEPPTPLMKRLSEYMSQAESRALPADVLEKTKYHILDTFAAMISGSQLTPGRAAIQFVRAYGGDRVATVAASNILCGPIESALANGVMAHADETDAHGLQAGILVVTSYLPPWLSAKSLV